MKADPAAVQIGAAALLPVGLVLLCIRRRLVQLFAISLSAFLLLELLLNFIGSGELIWWSIHLPSAIALGWDEILERHGVVISTAWHLADLVLWSMLLSIPMAIRLTKLNKQKTEAMSSQP